MPPIAVLTGYTRYYVASTLGQLVIATSVLSICLTHISYVLLDRPHHAWFEKLVINSVGETMAFLHQILVDRAATLTLLSHSKMFTLVLLVLSKQTLYTSSLPKLNIQLILNHRRRSFKVDSFFNANSPLLVNNILQRVALGSSAFIEVYLLISCAINQTCHSRCWRL